MTKKLIKFLILFDNTSLLYFPGQFLTGRVLIELEDETPAVGLHFHVVGEGVVRVRERVYDKENYIDFRMRLFGEPGQTSPSTLSPGIHSFPFKLGLPLGLPSTFLGRHGWIQYYCRAQLREPSAATSGTTHKTQQVFVVVNPIDLSVEPSVLANPFTCDVDHRLTRSGCWSKSGVKGVIECSVRLDRGAYVCGESVCINARVNNTTAVTVKCTRVSLTETIEYFARNRRIKKEVRDLATLQHGKIRPGATDLWSNELLYVPPLPPTNIRGSHLINIHYDVFFYIEPKRFEKEIKLQLPILIATYPHKTTSPYQDDDEEDKPVTHYPSTLPMFRPWLEENQHSNNS